MTSSTLAAPPVLQPVQVRARPGFIRSPRFDLCFFILSPLLAIGITEFIRLAGLEGPGTEETIFGYTGTRIAIFGLVWTYAHLFAVFFRSHANPEIFAQHRFRFIGVPILLFGSLVVSHHLLIFGMVLAAFWDVYHTAMQNFGFGRIYDSVRGNSPETGRTLDLWMNHLVYVGPILCGAAFIPTLSDMNRFNQLGFEFPGITLAFAQALQPLLQVVLLTLGPAFIVFYVYSYWKLYRQSEYVPSWQKIALLLSTATVSTYAWCFRPPLEAFFVANFFHGLQYFAIVWHQEKQSIARSFGLANRQASSPLLLTLFSATLTLLGCLYLFLAYSIQVALAAGITVSLLHFWYDSFVWSVRKREVG